MRGRGGSAGRRGEAARTAPPAGGVAGAGPAGLGASRVPRRAGRGAAAGGERGSGGGGARWADGLLFAWLQSPSPSPRAPMRSAPALPD